MKTITYSKLRRLSFCNSKELPQKVIVDGTVKEWVGIGWCETRDANTEDYKRYPTVVEG
jgi:hypothetical protein